VISIKKSVYFFFFLSLLLVFFDQALKIWVFVEQCELFPLHKTIPIEGVLYNQRLSFDLAPFFKIVYVENNGVAFGFLSNLGVDFKFFLTLFRLFAVIFICFFFVSIIRKKKICLLGCVPFSLVFAGALGNVIDSVFYSFLGLNLGPVGNLFQGRVIDMFSFSFFPPIFNLADSFVCIGVFCLLLFQTNIFLNKKNSVWVDFIGLFKR